MDGSLRTGLDGGMRSPGLHRFLFGGALDIVLLCLIATLSIVFGLHTGHPLGVAVDLAACLAAALTVRWPRTAGLALGGVLLIYSVAPPGWVEMGLYTALVAILGAGLRDERRVRLAMGTGYWLILTVLQVRSYPDQRAFLASVAWACLIAVVGLIGGAFAAFRSAQEQANAAALAQQRLDLSRDLHDSVARSLTLLARQADAAATAGDAGALRPIADGLHSAAGELRWLLWTLRESDGEPAPEPPGSFAATLEDVRETLEATGFPVTATVDGAVETVPQQVAEVLGDVIREAVANIQRHGRPGRPVLLVAAVDEVSADVALINEIAEATTPAAAGRPLGLMGAAERLAQIGGQLDTRQEGRRWITRVIVPLTPAG